MENHIDETQRQRNYHESQEDIESHEQVQFNHKDTKKESVQGNHEKVTRTSHIPKYSRQTV